MIFLLSLFCSHHIVLKVHSQAYLPFLKSTSKHAVQNNKSTKHLSATNRTFSTGRNISSPFHALAKSFHVTLQISTESWCTIHCENVILFGTYQSLQTGNQAKEIDTETCQMYFWWCRKGMRDVSTASRVFNQLLN